MKTLTKLLIVAVVFCTSCKKTIDTVATNVAIREEPEVCVLHLDPSQVNATYRKRPTVKGTTATPTPTPDPLPTTDTSYGVMLLDFNGQSISSSVWNNGQTFTCAPSGYDAAQIDLVINEVKADYARYKVIITTDENVYLQAHATKRIRVVVTPTSAWYTGVSGVTYTGSLTWGDDTPCFVFPDRLGFNVHMVAEICSHELGHAVGLSHQAAYTSACVFTSTYNPGDGVNAPLMGNSLYAANGGSWWVGPTPNGCTVYQDDNKILTAALGLR
jgi:hypothetical protein